MTPSLTPAAAAFRPTDEVLAALRVDRIARLFDTEAAANGLSVDALRVLRRGFESIASLLTTGEYADLRPRDQARTARLGQRMVELLGDAYAEAAKITARDLAVYGALEAQANAADLNWLARYAAVRAGAAARPIISDASLALLTKPRVEAIAARPMVDGRPLGAWWSDTATTMAASTRRELQTGLVLGEPTATIARRIAPAFADTASQERNVWRRARRDATAVVRTAVTAVNADTAVAVATQGAATQRVRISAVLDARTTILCASLDGQVWAVTDPDFVPPPYHINCRTGLTPVVDWAALGITPPPRARELADPEPGTGYERWLRQQPEDVQATVLGRTRAQLFRDGRSLAEFVTTDRRVLTLPQLAAAWQVQMPHAA